MPLPDLGGECLFQSGREVDAELAGLSQKVAVDGEASRLLGRLRVVEASGVRSLAGFHCPQCRRPAGTVSRRDGLANSKKGYLGTGGGPRKSSGGVSRTRGGPRKPKGGPKKTGGGLRRNGGGDRKS